MVSRRRHRRRRRDGGCVRRKGMHQRRTRGRGHPSDSGVTARDVAGRRMFRHREGKMGKLGFVDCLYIRNCYGLCELGHVFLLGRAFDGPTSCFTGSPRNRVVPCRHRAKAAAQVVVSKRVARQ